MNFKTISDVDLARQLISSPGETLSDTIQAKNLSQTELAERMGRPIKTINEIIQGKTSITPETAIQLERVLGVSAEFWLEREKNYRLELAEINEAESLINTKSWLNHFPLKEMVNLNWIDCDPKNTLECYESVLGFFSVSNKDSFYSYYKVAQPQFRLTNFDGKNVYIIASWLRRGEIQAFKIKTGIFNKSKALKKIADFQQIMIGNSPNFFTQLQDACSEVGIKLIYTPCLKGLKTYGCTRWIDNTPVIQVSNLLKRDDIFWFTFFHELGHILLHGKRDVFLEGIEYSQKEMEKEDEANEFAVKHVFPVELERELLETVPETQITYKEVKSFAKKHNLKTSIVFGRMAKRKLVTDQEGWFRDIYQNVVIN
ncbi:HigA family addiction module antitoxin [Amniculibacterium aquaticum]|uniref:HigA family addiction module antitoxin n=1 Tax=Amniculibacterium aquaticum TaxID=2479858 RepID=UPI000F59F93B|nr:HigA family addiction module antitoxin [Amniculibacterium aquaticum]